jgi:hypothetical protein
MQKLVFVGEEIGNTGVFLQSRPPFWVLLLSATRGHLLYIEGKAHFFALLSCFALLRSTGFFNLMS